MTHAEWCRNYHTSWEQAVFQGEMSQGQAALKISYVHRSLDVY